jgi:hypothetical protein
MNEARALVFWFGFIAGGFCGTLFSTIIFLLIGQR